MSYEQAQRAATEVAEALDELATVLGGRLGLCPLAAKIAARAGQVRADRFKVLVLGEFKRGKSTLLNAILGRDILPQKAAPCTAVVTLIEFGEQPEVQVVFENGGNTVALTLEEFRRQYELAVDDREISPRGDFDRFSAVDFALIRYPIELCRHRISLIDSPGLGEHVTRTRRTRSFLSQADAIVMVLDATQPLTLDELSFLESVLLPHGLKNIFFVVNKWNLLGQSVLHPEDAEAEIAEVGARFRDKLTPFCGAGGPGERIFRVNALGALKARLGNSPAAALEESGVPELEAALQRFLVQERGKARMDVVRGMVATTSEEVNRFIDAQIAMASKPLIEIESEQAALRPKLDRLRAIKRHIEGYLDAQSANLQDRLVLSFGNLIRQIDTGLEQAVAGFDLSELTKGVMVWKALTDPVRSEEKKFAKVVERHLMPQVIQFLEHEFAAWRQSAVRNEMRAVAIDVEKHLQNEAAEYLRVLEEIETQLGVRGSGLQVAELVNRWLAVDRSGDNPYRVGVAGFGIPVLADVSWLVGGIVTDMIGDLVLHMTTAWIPVIGAMVTGFRLVMREISVRSEIKNTIIKGIRERLRELERSRRSEIHSQIKVNFNGFKERITGGIGEEIALIQASLQALVDRRHGQQLTTEQERTRLQGAREAMAGIVRRIVSAATIV